MVKVNKGHHSTERECMLCGFKSNEWTRQHLFNNKGKREAKPFCADCHTKSNYYLAVCEERSFTWDQIEEYRALVQEREKKYGAVPSSLK